MSLRLGDTFMPFLKPHDLEIVMKNYQVFPLKASPLFIYIFYSNGPFIFFPLLVIQFQYSHVYMSGKTLMLGKTEGRRNGTTEDEMVGWCRQLIGHELEQTQRW